MSEGRRRDHPLLVGLAVGLFAADLVLGLNPHLLAPLPALRALLCLGLAGALAFSPLALRGCADAPARGGWAALAALLLGVGAYVESQRRLFYPFLANGSRRVLVAASLVAAGTAALALAAAWLRPSGRAATRTLATVAILAALPPLLGRRAPDQAGLASPPTLSRTATRSLLVIGVEGISWDLLSTMASEGSLPVVGRLLREGAAGPLGSLEPYDRAALWTTVATGKRPSKHGVVAGARWPTLAGELALLPRLPDGTRVPGLSGLPASAGPRRSQTFWEILARRGHGTALLNWPAASPPREGLTLWAAEEFFASPPDAAAARPERAARTAELFRVEVENLDRPLVRSLAPASLPESDAEAARLLAGAARDLTVAGATLGSLPSGPRNVSALVFTGLAPPARLFGPAAEPARYWGLGLTRAEPRAAALRAYYRFLDEVLGDLLEREGRERTLCLFSPASFGPPTTVEAVMAFLRGREPGAAPDAAADGFLLLWGSGIRSGVRLTSASVLDLSPTLLVLAGEPMARDMDGRVLAEAFDERFSESTSIPVIRSFEAEGGL